MIFKKYSQIRIYSYSILKSRKNYSYVYDWGINHLFSVSWKQIVSIRRLSVFDFIVTLSCIVGPDCCFALRYQCRFLYPLKIIPCLWDCTSAPCTQAVSMSCWSLNSSIALVTYNMLTFHMQIFSLVPMLNNRGSLNNLSIVLLVEMSDSNISFCKMMIVTFVCKHSLIFCPQNVELFGTVRPMCGYIVKVRLHCPQSS